MIFKKFTFLMSLSLNLLQMTKVGSAINILEPGNEELRAKIFSEIVSFSNQDNQSITFEQWRSPEGEEYVVPLINKAYGSGFKLYESSAINKSSVFDALAQELETGNIQYYLQEESITAAGFPHFWEKLFPSCDEEEDDDDDDRMEKNFPFGARKFLLVGVKEESLPAYSKDKDEIIPIVDSKGLLFRKKKDDDDCDDDVNAGRKLFDTDKFLFVGIGSVNETSNSTKTIEKGTEKALSNSIIMTELNSNASPIASIVTTKQRRVTASPVITKPFPKSSTSTVIPNSNFHPGTIITHGPHLTRSSASRHTQKDYKSELNAYLKTEIAYQSYLSVKSSKEASLNPHTFNSTKRSTLSTKSTLGEAVPKASPTSESNSYNSGNISSDFFQQTNGNGSFDPQRVANYSYVNGGPINSPGVKSHWSVLSALVLVGISVVIF